jgi:hypothetical protein
MRRNDRVPGFMTYLRGFFRDLLSLGLAIYIVMAEDTQQSMYNEKDQQPQPM